MFNKNNMTDFTIGSAGVSNMLWLQATETYLQLFMMVCGAALLFIRVLAAIKDLKGKKKDKE